MTIQKKTLLILTYIFMVTLNALANIIPINQMDTGMISDSYPNLFAPIGFTFSIWGLIYLLLLITVGYVVTLKNITSENQQGINLLVHGLIFSSIANGLWILAWHYLLVEVSLVLMLVILASLIIAAHGVKKLDWSAGRLAWVKPAIGVYLGWITVATIANVTAVLVHWNFGGFGLSDQVWMILILIVSAFIAILTMNWLSCLAYGLVVIWAYVGIFAKHISESGFNSQYPIVIIVVSLCGLAVVIASLQQLKLVVRK